MENILKLRYNRKCPNKDGKIKGKIVNRKGVDLGMSSVF